MGKKLAKMFGGGEVCPTTSGFPLYNHRNWKLRYEIGSYCIYCVFLYIDTGRRAEWGGEAGSGHLISAKNYLLGQQMDE